MVVYTGILLAFSPSLEYYRIKFLQKPGCDKVSFFSYIVLKGAQAALSLKQENDQLFRAVSTKYQGLFYICRATRARHN